MGCRTRVISDITDPDNQIVTGRGNLSFTSINLPRLAIEAKGNIEEFYKSLDNIMEVVKNQLLHRYKIQCNKTIKNYPFLMGQGAWMHSDELGIDDNLEPALKHGTLSIGFIGLAETLKALIGKHHGESETAQKLGLEIIGHMREYTDKMSEQYNLNFSLLATPAEGLSGRFVKMDKERFGVIEGVTGRAYYTNSSHVPVYYPISAYKKIQIEAPYQALCNAGHICYVELDGDPTENMDAFESVIRCMHDAGIGYGAVNHPVDRDPICGYVGIIGDTCPCCGRHEGEALTPEVYREVIAKNRLGGITYGT
jgi:ribonucleoside-triphosphate reductase